MAKYLMPCTVIMEGYVLVEADSKQQAVEAVRERWGGKNGTPQTMEGGTCRVVADTFNAGIGIVTVEANAPAYKVDHPELLSELDHFDNDKGPGGVEDLLERHGYEVRPRP